MYDEIFLSETRPTENINAGKHGRSPDAAEQRGILGTD